MIACWFSCLHRLYCSIYLKHSAIKHLTFSKAKTTDFADVLRSRVSEYLKENNISRHANAGMVVKSIFMVCLYLVPLSLINFGNIQSVGLFFLLYIVAGLGMAGVGMGVMHDALHGSYSRNKHVNKILGYSMNLIGGNHVVWKLQHNVLHHTFTNVEHVDDDISAPFFLRFSPHAPKNGLHRFQQYYSWFFYGLMTLSWITVKDFMKLTKYYKMGLVKNKKTYRGDLVKVALWKLAYYTISLILPLLVTGFSISIIFQAAHVMPHSEYPLPNDEGVIESDRMIHQMVTTTNFAPKSRIFSWFIGGLNFQVEHHLFPNICHVHYRKIAPIIKKTAEEYGVPYKYKKTFLHALAGHFQMLRDLGRMELSPVAAKSH